MSVQHNCPSCGAPLEPEHRFTKVVKCSYCAQTSFLEKESESPSLEALHYVDSFSILSLGAKGYIAHLAIRVSGRLRFESDDCRWDEWCLVDEKGGTRWLCEDEGMFSLSERKQLTKEIPLFDEVRVGELIRCNDMKVFVSEKLQAAISLVEGTLPFRARVGEKVNIVEGTAKGETWCIEYYVDEICLSRGVQISAEEITIE